MLEFLRRLRLRVVTVRGVEDADDVDEDPDDTLDADECFRAHLDIACSTTAAKPPSLLPMFNEEFDEEDEEDDEEEEEIVLASASASRCLVKVLSEGGRSPR